jgi:uncharacterized ubiquitin-like protein YukD
VKVSTILRDLKQGKNTMSAQTRLDINSVAALHKFLEANNIKCDNKSILISNGIELVVRILEKNGLVTRPTSTRESFVYFSDKGILPSAGKRSLRKIANAITIDEMVKQTVIKTPEEEDEIEAEKARTQKEVDHFKKLLEQPEVLVDDERLENDHHTPGDIYELDEPEEEDEIVDLIPNDEESPE